MASFYDTFTRANNPAAIGTSDSGVTWANLAGTMGILANQVYNPSGALAHSTVDLGMSDCVVRWQVPVQQNASAVLVRCTNTSNLFYIRNNNGTNYALSKIVAGVFTQLVTGGHPANGDYLTVVCSGPNITLYVNGIQALTVNDSFNQTETHFGVRCQDVNTRYGGMAAQALGSAAATWYIAPAGTWFGDGSAARPWDLRTGVTYTPGIVHGGDTIYARGGNYQTSGDPANIVLIGDGTTNYIDVRRYPGDPWPHFFTGIWVQQSAGSPGGVRFWSLQIAQNNVNRTNNYRGDNPSYGWGGMLLEAPNTEFHYCIIANNAGIAGGWFYGEQSLNSTVHMCLTYYNGFRDVTSGLPAGQGFYRQADDSGTGQFQFIDTCITGLNYQSGMQIYGSGASHLEYAKTLNSFWFYGGFLGASYAGGQAIREMLLGSTSNFVHADQCYFDQNWCWPQPGATHTEAVQLGYNGTDNTFASWTNNLVNGYVKIQYFRNIEHYGNVTVMPTFNAPVLPIYYTATIGALPVPAGSGFDHNTYYQSNDGTAGVGHFPFLYNDDVINHEYKTVPLWNAATGYDAHSTLLASGAQPSVAAVMRNTYEPAALDPTPRAFVYVFDFQSAGSVTLNVASVLQTGDTYAIYDWGTYEQDTPTPVATGTVNAAQTITLALAAQTLPTLIADPVGARSQHDPLPTIPAGQPAAYILTKTGGTSVTPIGTANPMGNWVTFLATTLLTAGLRPGERYYVCHAADTLPEKFGRLALGAEVWQGGDVRVYIGSAYPDAIGPFYLIRSGTTGCYLTAPWKEPLHHDAVVRQNS